MTDEQGTRIMSFINEQMHMTGTKAYFPDSNDNGDIDFFCGMETYGWFMSELEACDVDVNKLTPSEYFIGVYIDLYKARYNVFVVPDDAYESWVYATHAVKDLVLHSAHIGAILKRDKRKRVATFVQLRGMYYGLGG